MPVWKRRGTVRLDQESRPTPVLVSATAILSSKVLTASIYSHGSDLPFLPQPCLPRTGYPYRPLRHVPPVGRLAESREPSERTETETSEGRRGPGPPALRRDFVSSVTFTQSTMDCETGKGSDVRDKYTVN